MRLVRCRCERSRRETIRQFDLAVKDQVLAWLETRQACGCQSETHVRLPDTMAVAGVTSLAGKMMPGPVECLCTLGGLGIRQMETQHAK